MRKIYYFIDKDKIFVNKEFDMEELNEELDAFNFNLNGELVKIDLGQGHIIVDRAQFEASLGRYQYQCLQQSAKYHFDKLKGLSEKRNPQERSLARACIRTLIKEIKEFY